MPQTPLHVLMIGVNLDAKGGVRGVQHSTITNMPQKQVRFTHIGTSSYMTGTALYKLWLFARALVLAVAYMPLHDVVHMHCARGASTWRKLIFTALCKLFGVPYIIHGHSGGYDDYYRTQPRWLRVSIQWMFGGAAHTIALAHHWKAFYVNELGVAADKVTVLHNPVTLPTKVPTRRKQATTHITLLGKLDQDKGVMDLLDAMAELVHMRKLDVQLHLCGNGDLDAVHDYIADKQLQDHVEVRWWITPAERDELLAKTDIYTLPSYFEGLPMSIAEAMAFGLPVVSTPVGGIPDLVGEDNGFLVPAGAPKELATALATLVENASLRKKLGKKSRQKIEHCAVETYCADLHILYQTSAV